MKTRSILVLLAGLALAAGCQKENPFGQDQPDDITYRGTYIARDVTLVFDAAKFDSLTFRLRENSRYTALFFSTGGPDPVEFCSHEGTVAGFGTTSATFTPGAILGSNCDQARIPHGVYTANFVSFGDTIVIERRVGDSLYQLRLLQ